MTNCHAEDNTRPYPILLGLSNVPEINLQLDIDAANLIQLCQPSIPIDTDMEFTNFWKSAQRSIDSFLSRHQIPSLPISTLHPQTLVDIPASPKTDTLPFDYL